MWRGTLDELATDAVAVDAGGAGTIVIGDVVAIGLAELAEHSGTMQSSRNAMRLSCQ